VEEDLQRQEEETMSTEQDHQATLTSIAPRFAVGTLEQALAFYGQLGFATTYQDEGFAIVERDGIDLHLNPSEEPSRRHSVCWIGVTNIEVPPLLWLFRNLILLPNPSD
jgi:hypothetical protein